MKCPVCQAKLLPVDGELFCLQCGNVVAMQPGTEKEAMAGAPQLEETSDPVLQRAIVDAVHHAVSFRLPVSAVPPARTVASFAPMRAILAAPRPVLVGASAATVAEPRVVASAVGDVDRHERTVGMPHVSSMVKAVDEPARRSGSISRGWVAGVAMFLAFVGVNLGLHGYYANRVYPGVSVGTVDLGGVPLSEVKGRLGATLPQSNLKVRVAATDYVINSQSVGSTDLDATARAVTDVGRTTPLPLAGVIWSMVSKPLTARYVVDDAAVKRRVAEIAQDINRPAADAVPVLHDGRAFVVSEKAGLMLDEQKLVGLIEANMGKGSAVAIEPSKVDALVTAGSLKDEIEMAQAKLVLNLHLKVKNTTYSLGPSDIMGWLVVGGEGNALQIDGAKISTYVNGLPGKFDRIAAATALMDAVRNGVATSYVANTKKNTTAALPGVAAVSLPRATYTYCLVDETGANKTALEQRTAAVTNTAGGWGIGGELSFGQAQWGCNVTVQLTRSTQMKTVDAKCGGQTTCQVGSVIAISASSWAAAPQGWTGTLDTYREELLRHEVGHWLGFDHASCTTAASPISQMTAITLPGCSPNWYVLPVETQGVKVLPGF